jgi:hypothetical protein
VPSAIAARRRGATKASGANKRTWRSPRPSRGDVGEACGAPELNSSIQLRALAMAASRASRVSGVMAGRAVGLCTIPFTAAKVGAVQVTRVCQQRPRALKLKACGQQQILASSLALPLRLGLQDCSTRAQLLAVGIDPVAYARPVRISAS